MAFHARTAPGAGRAQWRRGIPGGIARELAPHREVTAVCAAKPCGLAGAIAAVAYTHDVVLRNPAYQARQQQPGQVRRGLMPSPVQPSPRGGTGQGHDHREGPGPRGERPLDEPRHDDPCMPPARGRIPVGRAPAITLPSLATHARPGRLSDRSVAGQEHRARWDDMVQQARDQPARQPPSRPPALGADTVLGRHRPRSLPTPGPQEVGDGPAARGPHGRAHEQTTPMIRWGRNSGPKPRPYRQCTGWNRQVLGPAMGGAAPCFPRVVAVMSPSKRPFPNPSTAVCYSKGQTSSSESIPIGQIVCR